MAVFVVTAWMLANNPTTFTYTTTRISPTWRRRILALVALLAGFLPARRASRLDPMTALREE